MRRIRYSVAASLDGYIAGPRGEFDWIPMDPDIDFAALFARFDTLLLGRRTYEATVAQGGESRRLFGMRSFVFSRTLKPSDHPDVTIVADDAEETLRDLREEPGKDIWLFGGGALFRSLLDAGLVDGVEVAIVPVLLGDGIPLLAPPAEQAQLKLVEHRVYETTGTVWLEYAVAAPGA